MDVAIFIDEANTTRLTRGRRDSDIDSAVFLIYAEGQCLNNWRFVHIDGTAIEVQKSNSFGRREARYAAVAIHEGWTK